MHGFHMTETVPFMYLTFLLVMKQGFDIKLFCENGSFWHSFSEYCTKTGINHALTCAKAGKISAK